MQNILGDLLMSKIDFDQIYQEAVDKETKKLFACSINELLEKNDYGSIEAMNQGIKINIGWWKWERYEKNCYHIVFKAQRKLFLFYRQYLNGIKFDIESGTIEYLSDEEIGDYD